MKRLPFVLAMALALATPTFAQLTAPANGPSRQTLVQSRIPMVLPSSGSVGNNGALTLTTALDQAYTDAYFYMPAGAIAAASVAGYYYGQMSDASTVTLYNNAYAGGTPTIPVSPVAFVTTGPGAYTQTVATLINACKITLPGGTLGPNDEIQSHGVVSYNNSGGVKTVSLTYGAYSYGVIGPSTTLVQSFQAGFANTGKLTRQGITGNTAMSLGTTATGFLSGSIDSTTNQVVAVGLKLAVVTDYIILQNYVSERIIASNN